MTVYTHAEVLALIVQWARRVLGEGVTVYQGGRGAAQGYPSVSVSADSTVGDGPVETRYDGADAVHSQLVITTFRMVAEGNDSPGDLTRQLAAGWTSRGTAADDLIAADVSPAGPPGSRTEGVRSTGVATMVRRSVVSLQARHLLGWRDEGGADAEVTEVSGEIGGDADAAYSVRLVPILSAGGTVLTVGPTALELSA